MTTKQVAERYDQLAKEFKWNDIQNELFSDDAESIEPDYGAEMGMPSVKGIEAIRKKGADFEGGVEEMHGGYVTDPVVGGNYFSVGMGMDVTMKGQPRMQMDEVAVYEVKDGKITKEQFFY